ncbi:MAG: histidine kinase [Bacteroidota bacterium]
MFKVKYRYLFILLLAIYSYLNILFTEGDRLFGYEINSLVFFSVLLLMVVAVWESNRLLSDLAHQLKLGKIHPLVLFFGYSVVSVTVIALIVTGALSLYFGEASHSTLTLKLALGFAFRINLFLHCVNAIYFFIIQYKNSQLEAETLKKQNAEARFEALRNQINPHFLFNSFNVLSSLVYKDADTSSKFIDQLSNVYRYLLFNQQNKIVKLSEEIAFLESYIYLLKIRFQDNLDIKKDIADRVRDTYIAPATLQLLIENAIKHNVVSKASPLAINVFSNGKYLIVENSIQLKEVKEESTNIGLNNIRDRYNYLCGDDAIVVNANGKFTVKIPIIETES